MSDLRPYHYPDHYEDLLRNTQDHEMTILHEDGLYRHLRFAKPGTSIWYWDLITWPGSLAIQGDIGSGSVFKREPDMLRFFDSGQPDGWINPDYWAEKTPQGSHGSQQFSTEKFVEWVKDQVNEAAHLYADEDVIEDAGGAYSPEEAVSILDLYNVEWDYEDVERWRDYNYHFILGLHAILWGAKRYHAHKRGKALLDSQREKS